MARDITEVIAAVVEVVPRWETALIAELERLDNTARYLAPERMGEAWARGGEILEQHLGKPSNEWQEHVARIWTGKAGPGVDS